MTSITHIDSLRALARKRLPRVFYDFVDGGSWTESAYRANSRDFESLRLRQRVAVNIEHRNLCTTMLGAEVAMPVALSPVGMCGMLHPDGEILAARAAARFGVPFTLSMMSTCSIEDIAAHAKAPFWLQLYVMRDRGVVHSLIDRARAAGCSALMITLDLKVQGQRHKDIRNGMAVPPRLDLANLIDLCRRPRWCLGMLRTKRHSFGNLVDYVKDVSDLSRLAAWSARQFDQALGWSDLASIKRHWGGPLILKGIMDAEDARQAVDAGADAIVVSNHGGRQLDDAASTISSLPAIAHAVGSRTEVWMDGGVRSGQDVLKALALGARATMIGRSFAYGLAAAGEAGVTRALDIIRNELDLTMALCGRTDARAIDPRILAAAPLAIAPG